MERDERLARRVPDPGDGLATLLGRGRLGMAGIVSKHPMPSEAQDFFEGWRRWQR